MAKKILDFSVNHLTGLTGVAGKEWTPFDFSSYGFTNVMRCVIDFDCVALATTETGSSYNNCYSAKMFYTYLPSGPTGTIVKTLVWEDGGNVDITWFTGIGTGGGPKLRAQANGTSKTFSICFAARMASMVEI
jgi:hypothetical protein